MSSSSGPTFLDCKYAIRALSSAFTASHNRIINPLEIGIKKTGAAPAAITISNNYFRQQTNAFILASAIQLEGNSVFVDVIQGNEFNVVKGNYAILISGTYTNSNNLKILDNVLGYENSSELVELYMGGASCALDFRHNITDNLYGTNLTIGAYHFHNLSPLATHTVEENKAICSNTPYSYYVVNSAVKFCNNESGGASNGFTFSSTCYGTDLAESHVGAHSLGVSLQETGPQYLRGNCWLSNSNYSNKAVICTGDPVISKFTVDGTITCHYPIGSINPPSLFSPNGMGYEACAVLTNEQLNELDQAIANGSIVQALTNPVKLWESRRYLYRKLYQHPELMPIGSQAASFYQAYSAGNLGEFHNAEVAWATVGKIPNNMYSGYNALLNALQTKLLQVADFNGQLQIEPNDASLQGQKAGAMHDALQLANDSETALAAIESLVHGQGSAALSAIDALTCDNSWQQNEKRIRYLSLLRSLEDREFTEAELDEIRDIAAQCPQEGGSFVTTARTFVPIEEQLVYEMNPVDFNCPAIVPLQLPNGQLVVQEMTSLIAPNPASGEVIVRMEQPTRGVIRIFDAWGGQMLEAEVAEHDGELYFDTSRWPDGVYLCQALGEGWTLHPQRFVVAH